MASLSSLPLRVAFCVFSSALAFSAPVTIPGGTLDNLTGSNPTSFVYTGLDVAGTTLTVSRTGGAFDVITSGLYQGLYIGSTHASGVYTLQFNVAVQLIEILVVAASQSPTYSESFTNFTADSAGLLTPTFTNLQGGAAFDGTTVTGAVGDYWFRLRFTADPGDSFTTLSFAHNQTGITYGSVIGEVIYDRVVPEPATGFVALCALVCLGLARRPRTN